MKLLPKARYIFLIASCAFLRQPAFAQKNSDQYNGSDKQVVKLSFGAELGITTAKSPFNYGLGFDLQGEIYLSNVLSITASGGYARLLTKDTSPQPDYDFLPLMIASKIYPIRNIYVFGNLGLGFPIQNGSKSSLIFGGGFGIDCSTEVDIRIKYTGYQQPLNSETYQPLNGQFALRFGYRF